MFSANLKEFLQQIAPMYRIYVYSAAHIKYVDGVVDAMNNMVPCISKRDIVSCHDVSTIVYLTVMKEVKPRDPKDRHSYKDLRKILAFTVIPDHHRDTDKENPVDFSMPLIFDDCPDAWLPSQRRNVLKIPPEVSVNDKLTLFKIARNETQSDGEYVSGETGAKSRRKPWSTPLHSSCVTLLMEIHRAAYEHYKRERSFDILLHFTESIVPVLNAAAPRRNSPERVIHGTSYRPSSSNRLQQHPFNRREQNSSRHQE